MRKLLDHIKKKLEADRVEYAMTTGTTAFGQDQYIKRVGICEGLQRAIDTITEIARAYEDDEDEQF